MSEVAVEVKNLSKIYRLYDSPTHRLKEAFHPLRKKYHTDFYALADISLRIEKGSTVGIVGHNGAGKSTLLKILTGVLTPSAGSYVVNGKVSSLLELGTGFNPELSGMDNVYFNGAVLGLSHREIDNKLEDILSFADIGEFIHQPVKTYSSGMYVRLAFAVAVQVDPDILIVDEALSVGDVRFQQKCFRRMRRFQEHGKTVIFVTHDSGAVSTFCDGACWLKNGRIFYQGKADTVIKKYMSYMSYGMETVNAGQDDVGIAVEQLNETFDVVHGIDSIYQHKTLEITGWAFINQCDAVNVKKYIVLKSDAHEYVFEPAPRERKDVTLAFMSRQLNLDDAGFFLKIDTDLIQPGHYRLGLCMERNGKMSFQYTDRTIFFANSDKSNADANPAVRGIRWEPLTHCASFGEGGVEITEVAMHHGESGERAGLLKGGESVRFLMKIRVRTDIDTPGMGISVTDRLGNTIFAIPSFVYGGEMAALKAGQEIICGISFCFPRIKNGIYSISAALAQGSQMDHIQHHWVHDAWVVEIANPDSSAGLGVVVIEESDFEIELIKEA